MDVDLSNSISPPIIAVVFGGKLSECGIIGGEIAF